MAPLKNIFVQTVIAALLALPSADAIGLPKKIKDLVTFGDSYTDVVITGDAGVSWPTYAAGYAKVALHPFARAGATCSNDLTYRPFPSLFESQIPLYLQEARNHSLVLNPQETLYTLWIGTNDLGASALLTESKSNLVEVTTCMVNWVKTLYANGARNFLFQNMIPLETTPIYSPGSYPNRYWSFPRNTTEWSLMMREMSTSGNALTKLMLKDLAPTLPGAHIGIFDSHSLFTDMYNNPKKYLNGTVEPNVTGCINSCVFPINGAEGECTTVKGSAVDSYLWYDELHPSEQADRIVAREIAQVIQGRPNQWTTWLS